MPQDGQRDPKGRPKGAQGHSKGNHRSPKGVQGLPKKSKGAPSRPRGRQRWSKDTQRKPKGKIYIKKLPINRPSGRYVIYIEDACGVDIAPPKNLNILSADAACHLCRSRDAAGSSRIVETVSAVKCT